MNQNLLAAKLRIKPGQLLLILNQPADYPAKLEPLPANVYVSHKISGTCDNVQVFVRSNADVKKFAAPASKAVKAGGVFWIMYPKLSSGIKTDINRDRGWELLTGLGWEGVSLVSVDETWSALRFKPATAAPVLAEGPQEFTRVLEKHEGMDATFLLVPFSVPEVFGTKAQLRIRGTLNGFPFKGTFAPYGGKHYLGITRELRKKAGISTGDAVHVKFERDTERILELPEDFRKALDLVPHAREFFDKSSYTNRKEYINWVETAKRQETRDSRIEKAIDRLSARQKFS
jgi:hypothetical protein